jgi:hypothetical protein
MIEALGSTKSWSFVSTARACAIGAAALFSACGSGGSEGSGGTGGSGSIVVPIQPGEPGNPEGQCPIPSEAQLDDVSSPTTVVGTGTPESCIPEAFTQISAHDDTPITVTDSTIE